MYSFLTDDNCEHKKSTNTMNIVQRKYYRIGSYEINKISLFLIQTPWIIIKLSIFTIMFAEQHKKNIRVIWCTWKVNFKHDEETTKKCSMKNWITFHKKSEQILIQSASWRIPLETLGEKLTVNQDIVEEKLNTLRGQLSFRKWNGWKQSRTIKQLRIREDRLKRKDIRVDDIEEDENGRWENTNNKIRYFLYDELKNLNELLIKRANRARKR